MGTSRLTRSVALTMFLAACTSSTPEPAPMSVAGGGAGGLGGAPPTAGVSGGMGGAGGVPAGGSGGDVPAGGVGGMGGAPSGGSGGMGGDLSMQDASMMDAEMPVSGMDGSILPPIADYTDEGPFATTMESNTGPGGNYAIFRPDPLGEDGFLHSPIIFGPGILTSPASYTTLLTHLASHGYVTICVNALGGGPGAQANVDAMQEGLDWLIAQNSEAGVFQGKLAIDRAATMGYSLGATASVQLSSHAAIMTTVAIHGHGTSGDPHGAVLLLTGTDDVIESVRDTQATLEEAPAVLMALPIGHLAVLGELSASGRYLAPITAWLRYFLNGDEEAKRFFWGDGCEMCSDPWITPEPNAAWSAQAL